MNDTKNIAYRDRLQSKETWWKQLLDVQRPYRANLRRLDMGFVLEVGCGIGRNLLSLRKIGISPACGLFLFSVVSIFAFSLLLLLVFVRKSAFKNI